MKATMLRASLLAFVCLLANPSWAVMLSLDPASQTGMPGDTVFLDLTISGLIAGGAPSLGAYDIDLFFDDTALDFVGGLFGDGLNDPFDPFTPLVQSLSSGFGSINLAEVSLLVTPTGDPGPLDATQADIFVLATLEFLVVDLDPGAFTVVDFSGFLLGDGFGDELIDVSTAEGIIRNPIPEPLTLMLLSIGVLGIATARRFA